MHGTEASPGPHRPDGRARLRRSAERVGPRPPARPARRRMRPTAVASDALPVTSLAEQVRIARHRRERRRSCRHRRARRRARRAPGRPARRRVERRVGGREHDCRPHHADRPHHVGATHRPRPRLGGRVRAGAGRGGRRRPQAHDHLRVSDRRGAGGHAGRRGSRAGVARGGAVVGLPARPVDARAGPGDRRRRRARRRLARREGRPLRPLPHPRLGVVALRVARALGSRRRLPRARADARRRSPGRDRRRSACVARVDHQLFWRSATSSTSWNAVDSIESSTVCCSRTW